MKKLLFLVPFLGLTVISCKKEEDSSSLKNRIQTFTPIRVGQKLTRTIKDTAHPLQESAPKGSSVSGDSLVRSTKGSLMGSWTFNYPEGIESYTLNVAADIAAEYKGYKRCYAKKVNFHCIGGCPRVSYSCNEPAKKIRFRITSQGKTLSEKTYSVSATQPKLEKTSILKHVSKEALSDVTVEVEALDDRMNIGISRLETTLLGE